MKRFMFVWKKKMLSILRLPLLAMPIVSISMPEKPKAESPAMRKNIFFLTKYVKDMELVLLAAQEQGIFTPKSLAQSKINPDDILLSSIILDWQEQHV